METERLILREFREEDLDALFLILSDEEANRFLPWYSVRSAEETRKFWEEKFSSPLSYAICLKPDDYPIGYINAAAEEPHDFGYCLRKEYWHKGITTEAGKAVIEQLRNKLPYITATHDRNNPRSGEVMQRLGMKYLYSYQELWQPKNMEVVFRLYQLNLDGNEDRVCMKYWEQSRVRFIENQLH